MSAPSEPVFCPALIDSLAQRLPDWASVDWVATTGSTNTDLLAAVRAGQPVPALLGADLQSRGRGRSNRNFHASGGDTLTFSCAFEVDLPLVALPTLSVLGGLAACEALARHLPAEHGLCLKWPNDLQWHDGKLAGLLLENAGTLAGGKPRVVIGIGLNLRGAQALSAALGRQVADWSQTGGPADPALLCADIARAWQQAFAQAAQQWRADAGLPSLPARYAAHDALRGRAVNVIDNGSVMLQGVAEGIAADARLRVRTAAGVTLVSVGDVSVRNQNGAGA